MSSSKANANWMRTLSRCREFITRKGSAPALRVFNALEKFADTHGVCWPKVSTLMERTGYRKRFTVFRALRELESLGVVFRRGLLHKKTGRNAPSLYKIGSDVFQLPEKIADWAILAPQKKRTEFTGSKKASGDAPSESPVKLRIPEGRGIQKRTCPRYPKTDPL